MMSIGIIWIGEKPSERPTPIDVLHDGTFPVGGVKFTLKNGYSEVADLGIAAKTTTRYFGKDATGDVNNDGRTDRAFLITQELGGTGTFFYLVALLDTPTGRVGTEALYLGDRIASQKISIDPKGIVLVTFLDRNVGESFTDPASIKKSLSLQLDPQTLRFAEKGPEGAPKMTLGMKKWQWISTIYAYGQEVKPAIVNKFTLTFQSDGKFSAGTDCNMVAGRYVIKAEFLTFTDLVATQMYCANSQERDFIQMLKQTQSYFFNPKGQLVFNLTNNTAAFIFN
jgi:heat shock protein HslJ